MSKILISYRRQDSSDITGRIHDRLIEQFGKDAVFKDVDSIPGGLDFRRCLAEHLATCDVMLVVMGPDWMGSQDRETQTKLGDTTDYVRIEVESALSRQIPVIPVLVKGAEFPPVERLPSSICDLFYRQRLEVRADPAFHGDMNRVIKNLITVLKVDQPVKPAQLQPRILVGIALIVLIGTVALIPIMTQLSGSKETCEKLIGDYKLWVSYIFMEEKGIKATSETGTWKAKNCEESPASGGMYILNGEEKTEQKVEVEINGKYEHVAQAENDSRSKLTIGKDGRLVDREIYYEREGPFNGIPRINHVRKTEQVWKKHEGDILKQLDTYQVRLEERHRQAVKNMHCIPTRGKTEDNREVIAFTCMMDPGSPGGPKYTRVMVKQNSS